MKFHVPSDDWRRKYFKWWAVMLILICVVHTIPHAAAQNGPCDAWADARVNRLLTGAAAVGALAAFVIGGPFGLGIMIGALMAGAMGGASDAAMAMNQC